MTYIYVRYEFEWNVYFDVQHSWGAVSRLQVKLLTNRPLWRKSGRLDRFE